MATPGQETLKVVSFQKGTLWGGGGGVLDNLIVLTDAP